ncbi:MAG TPA: DNA polymerase III subunit delta [Rubrobacter sp.]|jgi:DNA polymerase-3 subunit delta|nr:DNA polymerase III subunit delta [Rubrobacter sp.]
MTVYLLLGDDEERKSRGIEKLRAGRTVEAYDASETSPETLVSACNSFSLFGEGPFVVLKNLDAWNAAQKAVIVDYLKDPSPGSDLILLGKKLGARERLLSAVKNSGEVHTFDQPAGKALISWLVGHAKKMNLDLPEDVAEDLANRCSGDKMRLLQETEKLALYVGDGTTTHDDVAALCQPDVQSNIFAFADALAAGERDRALALLEGLISTGEPPLRLTFMIRRQFQLVARARALLDRGTPQKELSSRLKVPPFVARKLEEQGRKLDEEDLERALVLIQHLEGGLKGESYLSDELQVEMTVLGLSGNSA